MTIETSDHHANPLAIDGISFVEFCGESLAFYEKLFGGMGMTLVASSPERDMGVFRQEGICFVVNNRKSCYAHQFAQQHGPCLSGLAYRVADSGRAYELALAGGWTAHQMTPEQKTLPVPTLDGIGGSGLYFIQADQEEALLGEICGPLSAENADLGIGLYTVDHLTHNVFAGQRQKWVDLYVKSFNFTSVFELDATGTFSGMKTTAVISPCGQFRIAINEPTEAASQIQEFIDEMKGEGMQHIALSSHDLYDSIERISGAGIDFQETIGAYYDGLEDRLPGHGEDSDRLQRLGLLLDGHRLGPDENSQWGLLLQIFSKNLIGPVFFEFIQRKQNEGFGEGNAQALFESIERDQLRRGSVNIK